MICDTHRLPLDPAVNPSFSRSTPLLSAEFLWISSPRSDYGVSVASGSKHIHSPTHLHISRIKVAQSLPLRTGIQVLLVCSSESHQGLGNSVDYGHLNGTWEKHRVLNGMFSWNSPSKMGVSWWIFAGFCMFSSIIANFKTFPMSNCKKAKFGPISWHQILFQ
jgi:hypothetical protein